MNNSKSEYVPLAKCNCGHDAEIEHRPDEQYKCGCFDCHNYIYDDSVTKVVNLWNRLMLTSH